MSNILLPGQKLHPGEELRSENQRFKFILQHDGNLVLYDGGKAVWSTGTHGHSVNYAILQDDGNFVLYDKENKALFATNTHGKPVAHLILQDDRNLVLYSVNNHEPLWHTNTWIRNNNDYNDKIANAIREIERAYSRFALGNEGFVRVDRFNVDYPLVDLKVTVRARERETVFGKILYSYTWDIEGTLDLNNIEESAKRISLTFHTKFGNPSLSIGDAIRLIELLVTILA